jgi:hypothetical protein
MKSGLNVIVINTKEIEEGTQNGFAPFGREDLEDIISDLQEEYYRLDSGKDVTLKIKIADLIDRLCRLRETLEVI